MITTLNKLCIMLYYGNFVAQNNQKRSYQSSLVLFASQSTGVYVFLGFFPGSLRNICFFRSAGVRSCELCSASGSVIPSTEGCTEESKVWQYGLLSFQTGVQNQIHSCQVLVLLTPPHQSNSQNSKISFGQADSQAKIFLILYPPV